MPQLVVDRTDSIDGAVAHTVHTIARIGGAAPGLMVARSVFRSANWITGFKAAAVVVLIDNNGQITARGDPPTHGGPMERRLERLRIRLIGLTSSTQLRRIMRQILLCFTSQMRITCPI